MTRTSVPPVPPMRGVFLCSGIGGFEIAAEATGLIEIAGQVEIDPFCSAVLAHHWPDVPRMRDVAEVVGNEFGTVNLICAGFPCQPTSHAGKRAGQNDDRWLWPDIYRIIRNARPAVVLLENVPGLLTLGLADVLRDLAGTDGDGPHYQTQVLVYPASAIGATHNRERVFIVAYADGMATGRRPNDVGSAPGEGSSGTEQRKRLRNAARHGGEVMEYASGTGQQERDASAVATGAGYLAGRLVANGRGRHAKPGVGDSAYGLPGRLARHSGFPALPGEVPYAFEAARTVPRSSRRGKDPTNRAAKLKALGNALVPQQVYPLLGAIAQTWVAMHAEDGEDRIEGTGRP